MRGGVGSMNAVIATKLLLIQQNIINRKFVKKGNARRCRNRRTKAMGNSKKNNKQREMHT